LDHKSQHYPDNPLDGQETIPKGDHDPDIPAIPQEADLNKLEPEEKLIADPLVNIFGEPMVRRLFSKNWQLRS
jgi:hypothetical protein